MEIEQANQHTTSQQAIERSEESQLFIPNKTLTKNDKRETTVLSTGVDKK